MSRVLIRCDASLQIGSGHVIRCRTLARELKEQGVEVLFICRRQPGDLISLLEQEFCVLTLQSQPMRSCQGLKERKLYEAWLGCSQAADANECLTAITSSEIDSFDWVVVDHYGIDIEWETQLMTGLRGNTRTKLMTIDDLADREHKADLLIDQLLV